MAYNGEIMERMEAAMAAARELYDISVGAVGNVVVACFRLGKDKFETEVDEARSEQLRKRAKKHLKHKQTNRQR